MKTSALICFVLVATLLMAMSLADDKVGGCDDFHYGTNCANECNCGAGSADCNRVTGCVCKSGWSGTLCDQDIDECGAATSPCTESNTVCKNFHGSFECNCQSGYQKDAQDQCVKFNSCEDFTSVNCSDICQVVGGAAVCLCGAGFTLGSDNQTCIDIDECDALLGLNQCSEKDKCLNNPGGYVCSCSDGFRLENDGRTCTGCDDFHYGTNCAHECNCGAGSADCNRVNGCVCKSGWSGTLCDQDIDECGAATSPCTESNTVCKNFYGSFECNCQSGYQKDAQDQCVKFNSCEDFTSVNCSGICQVVGGAAVCLCGAGFTLGSDNQTCIDIDECDALLGLNQCSEKDKCLNNPGGYVCSCSDGFRLENDGRTCTGCDDFHYGTNCANECNCGAGSADCDPVTGCVCKPGWSGTLCDQDIDECGAATSPCTESNTVCKNFYGSFECKCQSGYQKDAKDQCVTLYMYLCEMYWMVHGNQRCFYDSDCKSKICGASYCCE